MERPTRGLRQNNGWIQGCVCKDALLQLVCFSHAGGNAAQYRDWQHLVPSEIEVLAVQLPGRANRFNEPPLTSLRCIAADVASALCATIRGPFAFFGHSLGALIAFEVARLLKRMPLLALIAAGTRAPHLRPVDRDVSELSDYEFLEELKRLNGTPKELLDDEEAMKALQPVLRGDFRAIEMYTYQTAPPLQCPIAAFGGQGDSTVTRDALEGWKQHTSNSFTLQMFPGDHFFVNSAQQAVIHEIVGLLSKPLERIDTFRGDIC